MTCKKRTDFTPQNTSNILSHVHTTRTIARVARENARGAVCCSHGRPLEEMSRTFTATLLAIAVLVMWRT